MDILKNKMVLGGVAVVLLGSCVYYLWNTAGQGPLLSGGGEAASPLSQEILLTLGQLHTLKLDPKLFTDPTFVSLTDFGVTIPPQNAGRRNPFSPVGGATAAQGADAGTATAPATTR